MIETYSSIDEASITNSLISIWPGISIPLYKASKLISHRNTSIEAIGLSPTAPISTSLTANNSSLSKNSKDNLSIVTCNPLT